MKWNFWRHGLSRSQSESIVGSLEKWVMLLGVVGESLGSFPFRPSLALLSIPRCKSTLEKTPFTLSRRGSRSLSLISRFPISKVLPGLCRQELPKKPSRPHHIISRINPNDPGACRSNRKTPNSTLLVISLLSFHQNFKSYNNSPSFPSSRDWLLNYWGIQAHELFSHKDFILSSHVQKTGVVTKPHQFPTLALQNANIA